MSNEQKYEIAKEYVDKQLATMKEFGSAPKQISDAEYKALVEEVAEAGKG
jgi:DNA-binding TFAR19-related protein (PDSD5 family)